MGQALGHLPAESVQHATLDFRVVSLSRDHFKIKS